MLRPGGRFAVSDVVGRGEVPTPVRRSMELWVGCIAGALEEGEFRRTFLEDSGLDAEVLAREVDGRVMGAFVRARKPTA